MVGVMSSTWLTLLVFCGFFSSLVECQTVPVQEVSTTAATNENQESEISPFLVVGVGETLYSLPYTWPEVPDQDNAVQLHTSGGFWHYITAIGYHYRRRLIFWSISDGNVRYGSFVNSRTKLNDVKEIEVITGGTYFTYQIIGDIAVDWIADRVYWTIRDEGKIEELDLETDQRRIVLQSEGTAVFSGLAIYPYPNNGWIYWTDREAGTIERVALTGEGRQAQLVRSNLGRCTWPLELDYSMQTLYWVDTCRNALRSLQITDSEQSVDTVAVQSSFSNTNSMTLFENILYWNEQTTIKATNKSIELGEVVQIFTDSLALNAVVVELVHPGKQPQEEEFIEIINENVDMETLQETCPPCVNGHCIPPGVCACDSGWTGDNCTTDVDECNLARDAGCDYECHNTVGSFYCSCNSSSYLDSDGRTCILGSLTTTYVIDPTVSTSTGMGIGPEETPPGVLLLPSSTSHMASLVATASPTPSPPSSTVSAILSTIVSGPLETPTAASETTRSDADSSTDEVQPSSNGMSLIVIAGASAGACVLLIIVVIIMIAAVVHYASKRCGSYTVNPDPEKKSNGTPSWISVVQSSPSAPAASHANGHSNGYSYRTKSFRASSPTCSTRSFT